MRILIRHINSFSDALKMRHVRNSCRTFMTRDRSKIGVTRQWIWWFFMKPDVMSCYIVEEDGSPVGYAIMLMSLDLEEAPGGQRPRTWLTAGLKPHARGRGLGRYTFCWLVEECLRFGHTPSLEVLSSNERAVALYKSIGFKEFARDGSIVKMEIAA